MATPLVAETVTFDDMKAGEPPPGWTATQTGSGTAKWSVEKDNSAPSKPNVLKQSGEATFPVCFKNDTNIKDGFVEVKFKPVAGKEDQPRSTLRMARAPDFLYRSGTLSLLPCHIAAHNKLRSGHTKSND